MRFMFKLVFWGFLVLLILPSVVVLPETDTASEQQEVTNAVETESFTSTDALKMAVGVAGYIRNVCAHDAELCKQGGELAAAALNRAKDGAVILARMVESHRDNMDQSSDPTTTSSINQH